MLTRISVKEEITERIKHAGKFYQVVRNILRKCLKVGEYTYLKATTVACVKVWSKNLGMDLCRH
jgi:hypothetical protein